MRQPQPRVALVGCGANARLNHMPALTRMGIRPSVAVDNNLERARSFAAEFGAERSTAELGELPELADCAIVSTPPASHAPVGCALLERGVHTLIEKPLATSPEEGMQIAAAARAGGSVVWVGLMRRHWHATRWLEAFLDSGARGEVRSFDCREGWGFEWPAESDYFLRRDAAGGVLLDMGSYVLDLVLAWFGQVADLSYRDDDYGGVEADCELRLRMESGAAGFVELSRTRVLSNAIHIEGPGWRVEIPDVYRNELRAEPPSLLRQEFGGVRGDRLPAQELPDLYLAQLESFFGAIPERPDPDETLGRAIAGLELISACHAQREPLDLPWVVRA